jgi:hypothetical protein
MKSTIFCSLCFLVVLGWNAPTPAQTVQGDVLRAKGRYLEGAGWYNLNTARADRINVESWKAVNREAQRLYRDYMADRAKRISRSKGLTDKHQDALFKKMAEDQRRWRDNPTPNAIAGDLADPDIAPSVWHSAVVPLPPSVTLTAIAFKIVDPKKSKIQQSTIALDRMRIPDKTWPLPFRRSTMKKPCDRYEAAVENIVGKCLNDTDIQADDFEKLQKSVVLLRTAAEKEVPFANDQRSQALKYILRLDDAIKVFAEQEYAEQLIRDVNDHKAATVAELLAFMRDYRLLFAGSDSSPDSAALYTELYGLLRRQKEILGLREAPRPSDVLAAGSVWENADEVRKVRIRITDRKPGEFRGVFILGKEQRLIRQIQGRVDDNSITWSSADAETVRGGPGPQAKTKGQRKGQARPKAQGKSRPSEIVFVGTLNGDELHVTSDRPNPNGPLVLRKTH